MSRKPTIMKVVNLEEGRPTLERARLILQHELKMARDEGCAALKIIHGYGSTGRGGILRDGVQTALRHAVHDGRIAGLIIGENWRISDEATWTVLKRHPEWKDDQDLNRGNKGISIVLL